MNYFEIIALVMQWGPTVANIFNEAVSNDGIVAKIEAEAAPIGNLISQLGSQLFPKSTKTLQTVGAIVAAFNPSFVKWLQGSINAAGYTPALRVDGSYGPKTTAGVEWVQKKLGITVDGIAGKVTEAALKTLVTKVVPGVVQK
jgi:murein L,D-transpeptidase YcbB/YkuD